MLINIDNITFRSESPAPFLNIFHIYIKQYNMKRIIRLTESQLMDIIDEVLAIKKDPRNNVNKMVDDYSGGQYEWFNNDYSHINVKDLKNGLKNGLNVYRSIYGNSLKRVVAKDGNIPAGYLIYVENSHIHIDNIGDGKKYPVICSTAVNPDYRNKGILKGMIDKSGIQKPYLVHASLLSPPNLWERFGCKSVKKLDDNGNEILKCE
jgi:hypothetical protein